MKIKEYFEDEDFKKVNEIIQEFHGRMLLDPSIKNPSAIILSVYMACNESKQSLVEKSIVKELFISLGRKSEEFDKALYELSGKRKGREKFIDIEKEKIGLNFNGLKKVKNLLKGIKDE